MVSDMNYWSKVIKRLILLALTVTLMFICFKLSVFYMPFLVSFVLALLLEPAIKFLMKKLRWTRKASAIFVMVVSILAIVSILTWGVITVFSEANNLLNNSEVYYSRAKELINNIAEENVFNKIPDELKSTIENVQTSLIESAKTWIGNLLISITSWAKSIPSLVISIFFLIMSLYFVCTDKIYMIDQLEHHLPEVWMKKLTKHLKEIVTALGQYLRAEATLIFVSFVISLIGFTVYNLVGLNIEFPLLVALGIGFVDALPILGSGTIMIPWSIICALNGDMSLGIAVLVLWLVMSIIRQFLEPRLVSKHIGIHPVFTLIAMYTGYKFWGVVGMITGPIILIVLKNLFAGILDKGVMKALFDRTD